MARRKRSMLARLQDRDELGRFCCGGDGGAVKPAAQRRSVSRCASSSSESGNDSVVKPAAQRCSVPQRRCASSSESGNGSAVEPAAQRRSVPRRRCASSSSKSGNGVVVKPAAHRRSVPRRALPSSVNGGEGTSNVHCDKDIPDEVELFVVRLPQKKPQGHTIIVSSDDEASPAVRPAARNPTTASSQKKKATYHGHAKKIQYVDYKIEKTEAKIRELRDQLAKEEAKKKDLTTKQRVLAKE